MRNWPSSPRAWGWTDAVLLLRQEEELVPTRVGVDRSPARSPESVQHSSPRAWGWTVQVALGQARQALVPTRVGVYRGHRHLAAGHQSRPHARGGGPVGQAEASGSFSSSPRAWGWTVTMPRSMQPQVLVPTRVGVDRSPSGYQSP